MAMKELFLKMQPMQLYVILSLTIAFFITELIVSHLTHALTLLMDSYHMLCNIIALTGCIITIKYGNNVDTGDSNRASLKQAESIASSLGQELTSNPAACQDKKKKTKPSPTSHNQERKLKNTFGWARIDVIFMLICCVFLASLSFSIVVEALQTLVHIDHHDEMHHPISVLCIGAAGLLLNGICYLLIGGYTFHQGSFLYVNESGDVVLNKVIVKNDSLQQGGRRLSRTKTIHSSIRPPKQRQGLWEMSRDINGCVLVIICALLIFFTDKNLAKYIDPAISIVSVMFTMVLSYPYMKESCLILLQTMPDTIDIISLKSELVGHFPDIVNVHDLHVWQLTANKVIATVHVIFKNPKVYAKIIENVKVFFVEKGITQVTIQPEFFKKNESAESLSSSKFAPNCLMACQGEGCKQSHCCPDYEEKSLFKTTSKEVLSGNQTPDLRSVRIVQNELSLDTSSSCNSSIRYDDVDNQYDRDNSLESINEERDDRANNLIEKIDEMLDKKIDRILERGNVLPYDSEQLSKKENETHCEEELSLNQRVDEEVERETSKHESAVEFCDKISEAITDESQNETQTEDICVSSSEEIQSEPIQESVDE